MKVLDTKANEQDLTDTTHGTEVIYNEVTAVEEVNDDKIEKDETGCLDSANFISVMKGNGRKSTYWTYK